LSSGYPSAALSHPWLQALAVGFYAVTHDMGKYEEAYVLLNESMTICAMNDPFIF
jgi:hypothetical protein